MRLFQSVAAAALIVGSMLTGVANAHFQAVAAPGVTNLRAGPGTRYTIMAKVRGRTNVNVIGCLSNLSWCDVNVRGRDGWMAGSRIRFYHRGKWLRIVDYYYLSAIPIIEHFRWKRRHKVPPVVSPVVPPCPFPDPRECQPLGATETVPEVRGGPDYPPNYKGGATEPGGGGPDYPPSYQSD